MNNAYVWFEDGDKPFTVAQMKAWLEQFTDDQELVLSGDYLENGYLTTYVPPTPAVDREFKGSSTLSTLGKVTAEIYGPMIEEMLEEAARSSAILGRLEKPTKGEKYISLPIVKEID